MANPFIGRRINYGIAKESTRGTWATPTYWLPWRGGSVDDKFDILSDESTLGVIEGVTGTAVSKTWGEGSLELLVRDTSFGLILLSLFGTDTKSTTSGETAVYDHTFSVAQTSQHQSIAITKKDDVQTFGYAGGVVTSLEIESKPDDFVVATVGLKCKGGSSQSATASYSSDTYTFTRSTTTVVRSTSLSGLSSGTAVSVQDVKITITPNVVDDEVLGTSTPNDFLNTSFSAEAEFTIKYTDATFHDFVSAQTSTWYRIQFQNTTTIGTSAKPTLYFDFSQVKHESWERKDELGNVVMQTIKLVGRYNTTDSNMVKAVLRNTLSTAYSA